MSIPDRHYEMVTQRGHYHPPLFSSSSQPPDARWRLLSCREETILSGGVYYYSIRSLRQKDLLDVGLETHQGAGSNPTIDGKAKRSANLFPSLPSHFCLAYSNPRVSALRREHAFEYIKRTEKKSSEKGDKPNRSS